MRTRLAMEVQGKDPAEVAALWPQLGSTLSAAQVYWGTVEPEAGRRDWQQVHWWEQLREQVGELPPFLWSIYYPTHMNERGAMPSDLAALAFDDPRVLQRFDAFCADFAERVSWEPATVLLGSEVDIYADVHPQELRGTLDHMERASDVVHERMPGARITHTVTYDALRKACWPVVRQAIDRSADVFTFTHYGLEGDMGVSRGPLAPRFADMEAAAGGKPIMVSEIALPTSPVLGSDEAFQAAWVDELFDVIEGSDRLEAVVWGALDDWPKDALRGFVTEQFPDLDGNVNFLEFLTSFGIRRHDGTPKPAFDRWCARARGAA